MQLKSKSLNEGGCRPITHFCFVGAVVLLSFTSLCCLLAFRYTCPFVEKFSIDIETYYKPDTGNQADVFNMSAAEKRQRTIGETTWY